MKDDYSNGLIGGINLGNLTEYLFFFANGSKDAKWQGATKTKGFVGDVAVDGIEARERTSGDIPYAGTIYTNDSTLGAWQEIVEQNPAQAFISTGETDLISSLEEDLYNAFEQINSLSATVGFEDRSSTSLDGLNTLNGINETFVVNVTSKLKVKKQIKITGDAGDVYVLRWDEDLLKPGYQGQVKFQNGGAIIPLGDLKPSNFIHVAGDIKASGGGKNPPLPYPQGPRLENGTGDLIEGGKDFSDGGFFTGYWLTTGSPNKKKKSSLSNAIFAGGWYTLSDKFSLTPAGTSGVYVSPNEETIIGNKLVLFGDSLFDQGNLTAILSPFGITPYPAPFYNEGKASNGLVLGETIAEGLGVEPDSIILGSTSIILASNVPNVNPFEDHVNYAVAGATSGENGSAGNNLDTFPIGLLSQVEQFETDFDAVSQTFFPNFPNEPLPKDRINNNGVLTAGSNDVLEVLTSPKFFNALITPDESDNLDLINNTTTKIVGNIAQAIDILDDRLNKIAILGLSRIGDTPFVIKVDQQIDSTFPVLDLLGQTRDLLTGIAEQVNSQLVGLFDDQLNNVEDVLVVDGFEAFDNALFAWEESLESAKPITYVSYLDYVSGSTSLPDGLSVEQFFFLDGVHPTNNVNEFLANEIVPNISQEFPHFTFA